MIVYRSMSNEEILGMINNKKSIHNSSIYGDNTFQYENGCSYKHFFVFAEHTMCYKKERIIGQYVIPNDIAYDSGFGFYGNVKTMRNDKLYHYYMPVPEIRIKEEDFKKEYLYSVQKNITGYISRKELNNHDNELFNEPIWKEFRVNPDWIGYTDYSYSDIYYEMVYQLAVKNNMDLEKVAKILKDIDLHSEIKKYFEDNINFFYKQTKEYIENNEKQKCKKYNLFSKLFH